MNRRHARAWLLGLAVIQPGCGKSGFQDCFDLSEKQRYEEAARRCGEVYAEDGDARVGAAAVYAHLALGQENEVLAWVDRLAKDGKVRPGVWAMSASVNQQRGDLDAANRDYRRDLELQRAAGDRQAIAQDLYLLAYNAWQQASYREGFLLAGEALEEAGKAQDRDLEIRSAETLYSILYAVGDLEGARQAMEATGRFEGEDPVGRAQFFANRGGLLVDEGKLALARRDLEQALELGAGKMSEGFFRSVRMNLTAVHLALGDVAKAAQHLEAAWKDAEPGKPGKPAQPIPTSLLYYRARVDLARKQPAEALRSLETALGQDPTPDWAWDLEYQRGRAEESLGRLAAAEAAYERSIGVVEEMRREIAFDDLKSWLLDKKREPFEALFLLQADSGRAEEALATVERAQARTFLDAFLASASAHAPNTPVGKPWSSASLQRIEGLESLLPAMSESPVASLQPIGQVLTAFGDRHGLIYFEAAESLWLLTVHSRRVRLHPPVPAGEVRRLGERFLAQPEDRQAADRLGEMLLPPGALPEKGSAIHVVADGILGNLPFSALRRGGRYLVEDHPVLFLPSLGALAALESRPEAPPGPLLVLADSRGDLPEAAREGTQVAERLGGPALIGQRAVSGELKKAARAETLHLALHTGPGPRGAWLQLADRKVSASEIVAGRIGPRLVVLASCSSGVRPGRQMWGSLGAAFLAAGSRAVLASLWSIEDEAAREFVLRFYAEGGAADPSGALARTQRVAIGQGQSPMFWAPFVLFGSDRPLDDIH